VTGWTAAALPFFPARWPLLLAALAAGLTAARTRLGLAFSLAVPILPLGNISAGLAILYAGIAFCWLVLMWGDPRRGLLWALGPVFGPVGLFGLLPLAVRSARGPVRRAALALAAVLVAGLVAGVRGSGLPFDGQSAPVLGIAGSEHPFAILDVMWTALLNTRSLGLEALVLATAAVALPFVARAGDAAVTGFGAAFISGTLLAAPGADALPLVVTGWATCAVLVAQARRRGDEAVPVPSFGAFLTQTRALFADRLKPGGGLGWPQRWPARIGHARR
jgi:hypothetical protein